MYPVLSVVLFLCISISAIAAEIDWPVPKVEVVASGFSQPTEVTSARDGSNRLFVAEKGGRIQIVHPNKSKSTFLDISSRVYNEGECGLLSICFPPGLKKKTHFYVHYVRKSDGCSVISRFPISKDDPNRPDEHGEQLVLKLTQTALHVGGQLAFGPDGYLYIGFGDAYSSFEDNLAQDPGSLHGKILRIDVEGSSGGYRIPVSNPFLNRPGYLPEIWAMGLRNPWRFSFDRANGDLYLPDVGEGSWEEINYRQRGAPGGENFGWPFFEGKHPLPNQELFPDPNLQLTQPVAEHSHDNLWRSIIGGYVYRGPGGTRLQGKYIHADFSGKIGIMTQTENGWATKVFESLAPDGWISSLGEGENGALYICNIYSGTIARLFDSGAAAFPEFVAPEFDVPANGTYRNAVSVNFDNYAANAEIFYTLDGGDPAVSGKKLPSGEPLTIESNATVRAVAVQEGKTSAVVSKTFQFEVAPTAIAPDMLFLEKPTSITMATGTLGARISYQINEGPWKRYRGAFKVTSPAKVKAKAEKEGYSKRIDTRSYRYAKYEEATVETVSKLAREINSLAVRADRQHYFSDGKNLCVYTTAESGDLRIVAGEPKQSGAADGPALAARFTSINALYFDAEGTLWIADAYKLRKLDPNSNRVSTVAEARKGGDVILCSQFDLRGNLLLGTNLCVIKIRPKGTQEKITYNLFSGLTGTGIPGEPIFALSYRGIFQTTSLNQIIDYALFSDNGGTEDGPFLENTQKLPYSMAMDSNGDLILAIGNQLRRLAKDKVLTTIAGSGYFGVDDGPSRIATFNTPLKILAVSDEGIYVLDHDRSPEPGKRIPMLRKVILERP